MTRERRRLAAVDRGWGGRSTPPIARLRFLAAAAIALSLVLPASAVSAAGAGASRRDVDQAVGFRARLGLRADRAFVESTFGSSSFREGRWGVPLDRAETAEVERRADVQDAVAGALRAAASDPRSAGAYLDQAAGGSPVFLTAGDPARARAAVRGKLPAHVAARFERVRFSTAELEALQARINADLATGALAALGVSSTSLDPRANAVVVGVAGAEVPDAVRAELAARYGDGVSVAAEPASQGGDAGCVSRKDCAPAKAGLEVTSSVSGAACTIGLMVRVAGSNAPRILTAGHCLTKTGGNGTSKKWRHDGADMGWSELATWVDGADADAGLINPTAAAIEGPRNLAYESTNSDIVAMRDWKRTAEQVQGSLVCRAGAMSGWVCGTIELTNRTRDVDGRTIDRQWVVNFDACPGDSGGPYVTGDIAWGIHTDSTFGCDPGSNQAWYSPLGYVWDVLAANGHPVAMCSESTCGGHVNAWTDRGSMASDATEGALVPLADGRFLAAGGTLANLAGGEAAPGDGPEVFDPETGAWSAVDAPPWAPEQCDGQFAVGLANGTVLVGGGESGGGGEDPCEGVAAVFDPSDGPDGSWASAATMPVGLVEARAVLLQDGRAFVTGGSGADGGTNVTLAYDPGTDEWATLAAGPAGGFAPLALRLQNGRVLVAGGRLGGGSTGVDENDVTAASIYNPSTDAWAATTAVGAIGLAGVVRSDGKVVVAGGRSVAGDGSSTLLKTARLFDPAGGSWSTLPDLRTARAHATVAQLTSSQVLVAGGVTPASGDPDGAPSRAAEVHDAGAGAWFAAPNLRVARAGQASAVLDGGAILVAGGGAASAESYAPGDVQPPTANAPATRLRSGATLGSSTVPVRVSWSASDTGGSGVGTYDVARSTDGGAFTTVATSVTGTSYDTTLTTGHKYRFQVRARDWAGNLGAWKAAATVYSASITQQSSSSVKWSGTWTTSSYSSYSGGTARYSKSSGASASYTFTARGVSFVAAKGPARGSARIYIDGSLAATVSLYSATKSYRQVLFQQTWSSSGSHTIKVVVVGTSGHPRVDVDAFALLKTS